MRPAVSVALVSDFPRDHRGCFPYTKTAQDPLLFAMLAPFKARFESDCALTLKYGATGRPESPSRLRHGRSLSALFVPLLLLRHGRDGPSGKPCAHSRPWTTPLGWGYARFPTKRLAPHDGMGRTAHHAACRHCWPNGGSLSALASLMARSGVPPSRHGSRPRRARISAYTWRRPGCRR
jgi:hypothetical protein